MIVTQHFSLNRLLLMMLGLWPYHQTKFVRFQVIFLFGTLTSFIACQFTALITAGRNFGRIIKIISSILFFMIFFLKYNLFFNVQITKSLLEYLQCICNGLKDKNEIAIIKKYGRYAKLYTAGLTLCIVGAVILFLCLPFWPYIIQVFIAINVSRSDPSLYIVTEYFVDREKYFYLILLHMDIATCIGAFALLAAVTTLIMYGKHACGMFQIACYRIEQAIAANSSQSTSLQNTMLICNRMILAIDMHRKALEFCKLLMRSFEKTYFFIISIAVSCVSLNLFRIFQIVSIENDKSDLPIHFMDAFSMFAYMFIINYLGQEITEYNDLFFIAVYNVPWYIAPLPIQKMILFLVRKGVQAYYLSVSGLFIASLECFASLTSVSISYFTVIYSTQK